MKEIVSTIRYLLLATLCLLILGATAYAKLPAGCTSPNHNPTDLEYELLTAIKESQSESVAGRHSISWWTQCLDPDFQNFGDRGGTQNLNVLAAAIALYRSPADKFPNTNITYTNWMIWYLASQVGQDPTSYVVDPAMRPNSPGANLRYLGGTELFSTTYYAPVVDTIVAVRYWAYKNGNAPLLGLSTRYLRANWALFGLAAGSGQATRYVLPGRTPNGGNKPTEYNPDAWRRPNGLPRFNGNFLALASQRTMISHWAGDDKCPLFARAIEINPRPTQMNEVWDQKDLLNKLEALYGHTSFDNVYGLSSLETQRFRSLTHDDLTPDGTTNFPATLLTWLYQETSDPKTKIDIRTAATYRIIGWQGLRATSLETNLDGKAMYGVSYNADDGHATFLFPWGNDEDSGGTNGWCTIAKPADGQSFPRMIANNGRTIFPGRLTRVTQVEMILPRDASIAPLYHLVLSGGPAYFDQSQPSNWPSIPAKSSGPVIAPAIFSPDFPGNQTWVTGQIPEGGIPVTMNDSWTWIQENPDPMVNDFVHQSNNMPGLHQHYFLGASQTLTVGPGDILYSYVYLNPVNPPREVMLQWNDQAGWEHRAFWGQDLWTDYGTADTDSRRYMGPLPVLGRWVALSVPASMVGLEGHTLSGMAYTLVDGQATWDESGKANEGSIPINLALNRPATQSSVAFGGVAGNAVDGNKNGDANYTHTNNDLHAWWQVDLGAVYSINQINLWNRIDCCPERLSNFYVLVSNEPFSSTDLNTTLNQPRVAAYYVGGTARSPSMIGILVSGRYVRVQLAGSNYLSISEVEVIGPASSATLPAPPPAPSGYEGFNENVDCTYISGWVWNPNNPSTRVNLSVIDDATGTVVATGIANAYRSDLGGRGDGQYGFGIRTPDILKNGQTHSVRVRVTGTTFDLGFTPRSFNSASAGCSSAPPPPPPNYEGFHETLDCNYLTGWVWDSNNPNTRVPLEVIDDTSGAQIATGLANLYRPDLQAAGKGDGVHGFAIPIPTIVKNGVTHNLRLKVLGNSYTLGFTPKGYNSAIAGCSPPPATDTIWVDDNVPPATNVSTNWNWVYSNPAPVSGVRGHQSSLVISGPQQHFFTGATSPLQISFGDRLFTYVYLDPANPPSEIMLQWYDASTPGHEWDHRAYWGANEIALGTDGKDDHRYMGALPPKGLWVRIEVPASQVGVEGHLLTGMAFSQTAGVVTWDRSGKSALSALPPPPSSDNVWVEDGLPAGAIPTTESDIWNWIGTNPSPAAGVSAHQSSLVPGMRHQHFFSGATNPLQVNAGDKLVAYVYLDPANPPSELMLQWLDPSSAWAHRAFWGADQIPFGTTGTSSQYNMGALPAAGQWIRLEVPANLVDLNGRSVNGMAFTLFGGRATFDHAGKTQ